MLIWPLYSTETAPHGGNTSANSSPAQKRDWYTRKYLQRLKLTDTTTAAWVCVCVCKPHACESLFSPPIQCNRLSLSLSLKKSVVYILNYVFIIIKIIQPCNQQSTALPKMIITTFLRFRNVRKQVVKMFCCRPIKKLTSPITGTSISIGKFLQ